MKIRSIFKYVFTAIGAAILAGAFYLYQDTQDFLDSALTTEGVVVTLKTSRSDDSTTYSPVVEFKTEAGKTITFTSSAGSNPPSYSSGEAVKVFYDESNPEQAKINGFFSLWGGAAILGGLGATIFLIGFGFIFFGARKKKKIEYLKRNGVTVKAKVLSADMNRAYKINDRHPYEIVAQWQDPHTSKLHIFYSENLWFDPAEYMSKKGDISVLIERRNPKKYYMDTSFLPKLAD